MNTSNSKQSEKSPNNEKNHRNFRKKKIQKHCLNQNDQKHKLRLKNRKVHKITITENQGLVKSLFSRIFPVVVWKETQVTVDSLNETQVLQK